MGKAKTSPPSSRKESEDEFLTLLQRIQRQYVQPLKHTGDANGFSNVTSNAVIPAIAIQRPPDEAAASLGRQLALKFHAVAVVSQSMEEIQGNADNSMVQLPAAPKGLQEKALLGLINHHINPAVIVHFLDTLLGNSPGRHNQSLPLPPPITNNLGTSPTPLVRMDWLPAWILQAESMIIDDTTSLTAASDLSFHALSRTVQASALYQLWCYQKHHQTQQKRLLATRNQSASVPPSRISAHDPLKISTTYRQLRTLPAKTIWMREWIRIAFRGTSSQFKENDDSSINQPSAQVRTMLSPLLSTCVLSLNAALSESTFFMETLWREVWAELTTWDEEELFEIVEWLTEALNLFLNGLSCYSSEPNKYLDILASSKEMGMRWLLQLLELVAFLSGTGPNPVAMPNEVSAWLSCIASKTLPRLFSVVPSYEVSLEPILCQILQVLQRLHQDQQDHPELHDSKNLHFLDTVGTLRFVSIVLANPVPIDVQISLQIVVTGLKNALHGGSSTVSPTTIAMLRGTASMLMRNEGCQESSRKLLALLSQAERNRSSGQRKSTSNTIKKVKASRATLGNVENIIQFLDPTLVDVENFVKFLAHEDYHVVKQCSAIQQTGCLLVGVGLLLNRSIPPNPAYSFLARLLDDYPHLGVSLLPVLVDRLNAVCVEGDAVQLQRQLDFLCNVVVKDTHCTREVWNLLGVELMRATTPSVIRAHVIRLFPQLCSANKKLYKRIIEVLGNNLATSSHNVEIRLAVAATLAELAKKGQVREASDIIGWIQGFIVDFAQAQNDPAFEQMSKCVALAHYSLLTLHYLLVAKELEYDLVLAVLNKRLCNVLDMRQAIQLPPLVLEALVLLLGNGEVRDSRESTVKTKATAENVSIRNISASVDILIKLALSPKLHPQCCNDDPPLSECLLRCHHNIFLSLTRYSTESIGIDIFGMHSQTGDANGGVVPLSERYAMFRAVVLQGIGMAGLSDQSLSGRSSSQDESMVASTFDVSQSKVSAALANLVSLLLKYEENALGPSLWHDCSRPTKDASKVFIRGQISAESSQLQSLPSIQVVQKSYTEHRCKTTSLAFLLCFEGKPMSLFSDLIADIESEFANPFDLAFTVQACLNASRTTLMELVLSFSSSESLENVLMGIREWRFRLEVPDNMYLTLVCMALLIPEILGPYGDHTSYVQEICEEVLDYFFSQDTVSVGDVGKLCIGLAGVCAVRLESIDKVMDAVEWLENSVVEGQSNYGAYYSLAVIAQSCPLLFQSSDNDLDNDDADGGLILRITAFLVSQLVYCISGNHRAISSLVACIESGEINPDVVDAISGMGTNSVKMVKARKNTAKALFIGLALCLPALSSVNEELLLGVYCLLDTIPWGFGKGMALASVLHTGRKSGLFKTREIEKIYAKHAKLFEEGMDKGVHGLDDIFYAVTATMTKTIPYSIRRFLVGNRTLFDDDGRAISLFAAAVSISTVPCLGCGSSCFTETAQLSQRATSDDIEGLKSLMDEAISIRDWTTYPQVAALLMGFFASMRNFSENNQDSSHSSESIAEKGKTGDKVPMAQTDTILEVVLAFLVEPLNSTSNTLDTQSEEMMVSLLGSLEVLSLPGHFAATLEAMFRGSDAVKSACTRLVISQIRGRPRAVFDGRDFIELALKLSKMPASTMKSVLGQGEAPVMFVEALVDLVPKFSSEAVGDVVENFWRLCVNQVTNLPEMTVAFLRAMKSLVQNDDKGNGILISTKSLSFLRGFLVTRVFAGIRDAPWSSTSSISTMEERSIVETYTSCLLELPTSSLADADFFKVKELDGFVGEALRYRCIMLLVRDGYFTTPSRASSEINEAVSWFSRQLTSSDEEVFSSTLLQVARSIAEATKGENSERRRELLLKLLDNLLSTGASSSFVGLQMLGVLICQWVNASGSDGDLSLLCLVSTQLDRWKELYPPTLQQTFRLLVHDLPFNLSTYGRTEKVSGVIFNLLWRIYKKWLQEGADQESLHCLRMSLVHCRDLDAHIDEDFVSLSTSLLI
eukprot:Nitzschia sp. Nitz4//scaffold222_size33694//13520//19534//NITZ4_007862-RA/size33694-processed-gene-0.17-mRNA-1//-1//CDS//3329542591//2194//frame0